MAARYMPLLLCFVRCLLILFFVNSICLAADKKETTLKVVAARDPTAVPKNHPRSKILNISIENPGTDKWLLESVRVEVLPPNRAGKLILHSRDLYDYRHEAPLSEMTGRRSIIAFVIFTPKSKTDTEEIAFKADCARIHENSGAINAKESVVKAVEIPKRFMDETVYELKAVYLVNRVKEEIVGTWRVEKPMLSMQLKRAEGNSLTSKAITGSTVFELTLKNLISQYWVLKLESLEVIIIQPGDKAPEPTRPPVEFRTHVNDPKDALTTMQLIFIQKAGNRSQKAGTRDLVAKGQSRGSVIRGNQTLTLPLEICAQLMDTTRYAFKSLRLVSQGAVIAELPVEP